VPTTFTIPVYQRKLDNQLEWTTLLLGSPAVSSIGASSLKVQKALADTLKSLIAQKTPLELEPMVMSRGMRLERVHLELTLKGAGKKRKISGTFPVVLEPRWVSEDRRLVLGYHPRSQQSWFPVSEDRSLAEQAEIFFSDYFSELPEQNIHALTTNGKDSIRAVSFTARPKSLLDQLPEREKGIWDDLYATKGEAEKQKSGALQVLPKIGSNQTNRAIEGLMPIGIPRAPYREQLHLLLLGQKKRSVIVVGAPGSGKSTIVSHFVDDLLRADDWDVHKNIDRIHEVWQVSGKRIIAGMSYLGDWEQRCVEILQDAKRKRVLLYIDDLYAFGRIGQTRESERSLADFFRGAISRGELTIIAECTPEQLQRLEDDAPSFAALFSRIFVQPTSSAETLRMVIHEARALELKYPVAFEAFSFRSILELGGSLFPGASFPGKALDQLRELARSGESGAKERKPITPDSVIELLSKKTGIPKLLLEPDRRLDPTELHQELSKRVIGQEAAMEAAVDLVLRIRAGLVDTARPYGVYLFTGPTGTGKTELASNIASYLYGDSARMLRFDMSELSGPDAPSRLIGDRFNPEGWLTQRVLDQPFSVVLLDEIEKAHPSVLNLLLQVFDEGRLTDAKGSSADFRHTVVIMTSNLGARVRPAIGFEENAEGVLFDIARAVKDFFPPELFNRIDRVVPFRPLTHEIAKKIADRAISDLMARRGLVDRNVFVYTNDAVVDRIVKEAFDPKDGARPVKRYVEAKLGTMLTNEIVKADRASMQIFRIIDAGGNFRLYADRVVEAEQTIVASVAEPLLALVEERALEPHLENARAQVRRTRASKALQELSREIGARIAEGRYDGSVYELETMRLRLKELEEHLDELIYKRITVDAHKKMLAAIAEAQLLERALTKVGDSTQHAVLVELLRTGRVKSEGRLKPQATKESCGLFEALVSSYLSTKSELEGMAIRTGGTVQELKKGAKLPPITAHTEHVALHLSGLAIYDQLIDETGCHIGQSLAEGTELIRVRVLPETEGMTPRKMIETHMKARRLFQEAMENNQQELPYNPEALLPAVRVLRFEAQEREGVAPYIEVEDYKLGYYAQMRVRRVEEVLERLALMRISKVTS
jgi:ATP-dependent Clp protease ATP-binding subunit ClpA/ATP-dependent Clp protease ATP-binding subunit ClpC